MSIDYRYTCDKCWRSFVEGRTEIFCNVCFTELENRREELEEELEDLKAELAKREE